MAWFVLLVSGAFEAVWAVALSASDGFRKRTPTLVFLTALVVSMGGLAWALRELPTGTAYTVWVGVGATLTVVWGFLTGQERPTLVRILLLGLLIGSIVGLQAVS